MNNYIGKTCPFCKTEFKESDDIVVCGSCDMPHHKDCWIENQGCTTFGCTGTIQSVNNNSNSVTATECSFDEAPSDAHVFCTKCGAKNSGEFAFCNKCGNPLKTVAGVAATAQQQPTYNNATTYSHPNTTPQTTYITQNPGANYNNSTNNVTIDPDVEALIGEKQVYYVTQFKKAKANTNHITWNWTAFFFAPFWLMYRKMYAYGAAVFAVNLIILLTGVTALQVLSTGLSVAAGLFGNYIYMLWLEKKAAQARMLSDSGKMSFIKSNSGVNLKVAILSVVAWYVLVLIIFNI